MSKKIEDYLHLYLGCEVEAANGLKYENNYNFIERLDSGNYSFGWGDIKPILRPLSDMSNEEAKIFFGLSPKVEVYQKINYGNFTEFLYKWEDDEILFDTSDGKGHSSVAITHNHNLLETLPDGFFFLLSNLFDVFGLIGEGLAIDSTTLNATLK